MMLFAGSKLIEAEVASIATSRQAKLANNAMDAVAHTATIRGMFQEWLDRKLREKGRGSQRKLATLLNLDPSAITRMQKGDIKQRRLRADEVAKIADFFNVGRAEVLALSLGLSSDDPPPEFSGLSADAPYEPRTPGARPEIDVTPGAGEGTIGEGSVVVIGHGPGGLVSGHRVIGEWVFPPGFLRTELKASPDQTLVLEVKGDSMLPTLSPGDRVIVDLRQNAFGPDAVYVIDDGDSEPRVKRLRKVTASNPPEVEVVSDNPVQRSDRVELDRIRVLGRVVGRVSRL